MKVKELLSALDKCDPEAEVITEGCDCNGDSAYVSFNSETREVFILRSYLDDPVRRSEFIKRSGYGIEVKP